MHLESLAKLIHEHACQLAIVGDWHTVARVIPGGELVTPDDCRKAWIVDRAIKKAVKISGDSRSLAREINPAVYDYTDKTAFKVQDIIEAKFAALRGQV